MRDVRFRSSDAMLVTSLAIALLFAGVAVAPAATITVNSTAQSPGGAGDCTLGEAIVAANTNAAVDACSAGSGADTISLPAGTYTMTVANNADNALPIVTSDITIQGAGAATTVLERSLAAAQFRFLQVSSGTLTLNDVTMRNGNVVSNGGAIYFPGTTVIVNDSVFTNNTATFGGGALSSGGFISSLTVTDSSFSGNSSTNLVVANGGAIQVFGTLTVSNSTFDSNTAGVNGGAIAHLGGVATITNSVFSNNSAQNGGAVISGRSSGISGIPIITSSTFTGNSAQFSGGALVIDNSTVVGAAQTGTITNSRFTFNAAGVGGAIHTANTIVMTGSVVSFNSADFGGGVSNAGNNAAVVTIENSTISSNTAATDGGGLYVNIGGTFDLNNVTVTNNVADSDANGVGNGGGVYNAGLSGVNDIRMVNTIVAGNHDGAELTVSKSDSPDPATTGNALTYTLTVTKLASSPDCFGSIISDGFNLIGTNEGCAVPAATGDIIGTGAAPVNPDLGPLQDNGGPTETHALEVGSPAIDAGSNLAAPGSGGDACLATDQRGVARPVGPRCDIGAFEGSVAASAAGPSTGFSAFDTLPSGVTFVSAIPSQGVCNGDLQITCNLGPIGSGGTATVAITVTPTAAGTITNNVTARATGVSAAPAVADSEETTVNQAVITADLSITKTDAPDPVTAGGNIGYTITVTNNGPSGATNVVVADTIPSGTSFVSASAGCTGTTTVTCTTPSMASGTSVVHTITVSTSTAGSVSNTATVTATEGDSNAANNSATVQTTVTAVNADVAITKTDAPDPVTAGGNITYTITVTNNGPSAATNVVVTDAIPSGTSFVSTSVGCTGTATVTCTTASLASGATVVHTITVSTSSGGSVSNTATVTATQADPNATNNSATARTTVFEIADAIPALSLWGIALLGALLAVVGLAVVGKT